MKCKDCACYKNEWCSMVPNSPDPDMERDCGLFIRARRWIPVEERLPDEYGWYLGFTGNFVEAVAYLESGWSFFSEDEEDFCPYPNRVTHWMPLPGPPEVSE